MTVYSYFVIIAISLVFLPSIISYLINLRPVQFVKAGKVDDFCVKYCFLSIGSKNRKFKNNDKIVNSADYEVYRVHGNSMHDYGINNGQDIFVAPFTTEESKESMTTHPVLMIRISEAAKFQSQYKLRKFISYIEEGEEDWGTVFDLHKDRIDRVSRESFIASMKRKLSDKPTSSRMVLSATYNEHGGIYEYSLHPISLLYGIVKYAA